MVRIELDFFFCNTFPSLLHSVIRQNLVIYLIVIYFVCCCFWVQADMCAYHRDHNLSVCDMRSIYNETGSCQYVKSIYLYMLFLVSSVHHPFPFSFWAPSWLCRFYIKQIDSIHTKFHSKTFMLYSRILHSSTNHCIMLSLISYLIHFHHKWQLSHSMSDLCEWNFQASLFL